MSSTSSNGNVAQFESGLCRPSEFRAVLFFGLFGSRLERNTTLDTEVFVKTQLFELVRFSTLGSGIIMRKKDSLNSHRTACLQPETDRHRGRMYLTSGKRVLGTVTLVSPIKGATVVINFQSGDAALDVK